MSGRISATLQPSSIIKEIQTAEPYFTEKVDFANILLASRGVNSRIPVLDLPMFRSHYKSLHKYLHTQYLPTYLIEAQWWQQLQQQLISILEFTRPFLEIPKVRVSCNDSGLELFHRFRRKEVSAESLLKIARNNPFNDAEIRLNFRQFPQE
jgi:hypothetical protein